MKYRDGWWDMEYFELIRQILKRKFFAILNEDTHLPDESFDDLQTAFEDYARSTGIGPFRTAGAPEDVNETEGTDAQEADQSMQSAAVAARRKAPTMRRAKITPKPKALDPQDRSRSRSRFSMGGEGYEGSPGPVPQAEDTIMEEQEES